MAIGLIRLITTQKVLKTWSVKGMKQHYLGSNQSSIFTNAYDLPPRLVVFEGPNKPM